MDDNETQQPKEAAKAEQPEVQGEAATAPRQQRSRGRRQQPKAQAEAGNGAASAPPSRPRMLERYRQDAAPAMARDFSYANVMEIPRLTKVVVNVGLGESLQNPRALEAAMGDLTAIVGQRPVTTKARKSIAGFKLRKGMTIGAMATLRGRRMWEFLDRLINVALPRIRDFRGISRHSFDGRGNFSLGLREQVIFPEIDYNSVDRLRGLQIAIVTTAKTDEESLRLLEHLGMPFSRN